jgi:GPH family glycoside/pentoside/hexuronide:cation symporter
MTDTLALPPIRRLSARSTLAYGFGSIAYGVKDNGFQAFLLIFYNQVMGLPAVSVGGVIMLALLIDALIDPLIGVASDQTRSRWGRRHPWMYAAALPIAGGWLLLWNPPALSHGAMLAWIFVSSIIVRSAVSAYEVPSAALTAELTADYDERTRISAYRYLFGWAGGLTMLVAAYTLFLVPTTEQPNGLLNREGYRIYALVGSLAMFVSILVSAAGTHHEIRRLPNVLVERVSLGVLFRQVGQTFRNRAFAMLMLAGLCGYTAQGLTFAISNYLYSFVWSFAPGTFVWLGAVLFAGVVVAFVVAPRVTRRLGKRKTASLFMFLAPLLLIAPYLLRLAGWFPSAHSPALLPVLFATMIFNVACAVAAFMTGTSMMADVVEQSESVTGRRSEGAFFAGNFFVQKATGGIGIFLAGLVLSLADFPANASPGSVAIDTIDRLTIAFSVIVLGISWTAAWFYARFPFERDEHEARIEALAQQASGLG